MMSALTSAKTRLARAALAALATAALLPGAASAQNDGNVSLSSGVDFANKYYFRGIVQETSGFIAQPYLEASIDFGAASFTAGTWNSLHSAAPDDLDPKIWYESDFYAGLGFGGDIWEAGITYTAYMSPNQQFGTVKEVAFNVGFSDPIGLSPSITLAVELGDAGAAGEDSGSYFEVGVEPAIPLADDAPVSLSIPVTLGLGSGYYDPDGVNGAFGFFNVGLSLGIPLSGVPAEYGSWELAGGVSALVFGDALKTINGTTSSVEPIITFGLSIGY